MGGQQQTPPARMLFLTIPAALLLIFANPGSCQGGTEGPIFSLNQNQTSEDHNEMGSGELGHGSNHTEMGSGELGHDSNHTGMGSGGMGSGNGSGHGSGMGSGHGSGH